MSAPSDGRPRLKRHLAIVAHSADVVELRHGTWNPVSFTLSDDSGAGALLGVLSRLDGLRSLGEVAAEAGVSRREVDNVVRQLAELDLIEERAEHALDFYIDHVVPNLLPFGGRASTPETSVLVFGEGGVPGQVAALLERSAPGTSCEVLGADDELRALLRDSDIWLRDGLSSEEHMESFAGWSERFVAAASARVDPCELHALNRIALHHRFAWIHAAVDGPFLLVGPTFVPGRSACYECLDARVLMNMREAGSYLSYKRALAEGRVTGGLAPLDATLEMMLASHTAFEALNYLLTGAAFTVGKMLAIYLPTMEFTFNEVLRLPGCPACGPAPERDDRELYFEVRALLNGDAPQSG
jgi:bacteriocin biosynthesis cyclodehydratase domain-containing protein